jgi:hypothetical protein
MSSEIGCHCVVCNEDYGELYVQKVFPRILSCGHSVCSQCLAFANFVACPLRCPGNISAERKKTLPVNRLAQEILAHLLDQKRPALEVKNADEDKNDVVVENCHNWSQCKQKARYFCRECSADGMLLCEGCSDHMHKLVVFKNHTLQPPKRKETTSSVCANHRELLKFLCETDGQVLCRDCFDPSMQGAHIGHKVIEALPAIEKKFEELQGLLEARIKDLSHQRHVSRSFLEKMESKEAEFKELISLLSRHKEQAAKEMRSYHQVTQTLMTKLQAALNLPKPSIGDFVHYFKAEVVNCEKLLQQVDPDKSVKIIESSCDKISQTMAQLQSLVDEMHKFDWEKRLPMSPSRSTVYLQECGEIRGEIRITGIDENGERTGIRIADFEICFEPAEEVKYEIERMPDQEGMWRILYELTRKRDQTCAIKYLGEAVQGSPLILCRAPVEAIQDEQLSKMIRIERRHVYENALLIQL